MQSRIEASDDLSVPSTPRKFSEVFGSHVVLSSQNITESDSNATTLRDLQTKGVAKCTIFFWIRTRRCSGSSPVNCHERALPITRRSRNLGDLQQGIALVKITREIEMHAKSSLIHSSELVEAKRSSGETHMESYPLSLSRTEKASRVPRKFLAFSI